MDGNGRSWLEIETVAKLPNSGRRQFLKASMIMGVAAPVVPGFAQDRAPPEPAKAPGPTGAAVKAETSTEIADTHQAQLIEHPGSDFMVDLLKHTEIGYVAAMAGSSFRGLHESIVNYGGNRDPQLIVCAHEETSAAICHGYAKVAGKPMACLVHSTVGLQHASMAIYNAWCDRVPMMIIAANHLDATTRRPGVEWTHTAQDLGAMVREYVKYDDAPHSLQHFAESYMRAYEISMTPPFEPVLLVADGELQEKGIDASVALSIPKRAPVQPSSGSSAALSRIADLLVGAERPLIVADRAARSQAGVDWIVKLAEILNAPVVDLGGRMNMPTTHFLNQSSLQHQLVGSADVILGLELTDIWGLVNSLPDTIDRGSRRIAKPDAKVIGISANYGYIRSNVQDAQRYYASDVTVDADAQECLPEIIAAVEARLTRPRKRAIAARTASLKQAYADLREADAAAAAIGWDASPISTARLSMELWEQIKDLDWGLVSNSAFISMWPQRLWDIDEYHQYIGGEGGYGIGYTTPASVGAALAHRDAGRFAVSITGDGDLMMLPGTLWTMAHHSVPLLTVMHNNRAWHQETMHLKRMSSRRNRDPESWRIGTVIDNPHVDFAAMARSMGVWAEGPIGRPEDLAGAISRALDVVKSGKPALLDTLTQMR